MYNSGNTILMPINSICENGVSFKFNGRQMTMPDGEWADLQAMGRLRRVN